MRGELEEIDLAARLSDWLAERDNARFITRQITDVLAAVFKSGIGTELAPKSAAFLQQGILEAVDSAAMSREVSALLKKPCMAKSSMRRWSASRSRSTRTGT